MFPAISILNLLLCDFFRNRSLSNSSNGCAVEDAIVFKNLQTKATSTARGAERKCRTKFPYQCFGIVPNRKKQGVSRKKAPKANTKSLNSLEGRVRRAETVLLEYLPTNLIRRFFAAKDLIEFETFSLHKESVFASAALAVNYQSASHTDDDFFLSILEVRVARYYTVKHPKLKGKFQEHVDVGANIENNPNVVQGFVFPTVGVTVLLRPGDRLIFNPNIPHCCTQHDIAGHYQDFQIQLTSFYLKSRIAGGNNNSRILTHDEKLCHGLIQNAES